MIRRVLTPAEGDGYLKRVANAFCLGTAMEVRFRMFGEYPEMGHQFWLSDAAAIALTGDTASVVGDYDPEEMGAFLQFSGAETLITEGGAPIGWEQRDTLFGYAVKKLLPVSLPAGITIDTDPPMMDFARIVLQGKDMETIESFYAQSCAKRNHGTGLFWTAEQDGRAISAVAASEITAAAAYMSQGHTLPQYRGRGVGGALIASMANHLLEQGVMPCWLCLEERCHFYEKMGATLQKEYNLYKKKEI